MPLRYLPPNVVAAIVRYYQRTEKAELDLIAAGVAFYAFLAMFPAAAVVIAIWRYVYDPSVIREEVALLKGFLPPDAYTLISGQVESLLNVEATSLGWTTVVSFLIAFWSARAGVAALIRGLNAIHHLPNRSGHWHQLRALVLTFVLIGLVLAFLVVAVILPLVMAALPLGAYNSSVLNDSNLLLGIVCAVLAVGLAYRLAPNYSATETAPPMFSWGLLVAVVLWVLATRGFMLYLANFNSYNRVYGSIGAVVVLMMWLYVSAYAILLGAAVDAERNIERPPKPKRGAAKS